MNIKTRYLHHSQPHQATADVVFHIVHRHPTRQRFLKMLSILLPLPAIRPCQGRLRIAHHPVIFQLGRMLRGPVALQIIRTGTVNHTQAAQRLADQAAVAEVADAHHAIDPFLDQID
ncbi:hypothetical protein D3C75_1074180 [compost metagenome]